jgi:hypothetical protein
MVRPALPINEKRRRAPARTGMGAPRGRGERLSSPFRPRRRNSTLEVRGGAVAEGYRAMDERRAIEALLRP